MRPDARQSSGQVGIGVRAAANQYRWLGRRNADLHGARLAVAILTSARGACRAGVGHRLHRYVNHSQHWVVVPDQGNIDRELAIAIDKFLGAVQGIDQPVFPPAGSFLPGNGC